jgi:hypothetical protein
MRRALITIESTWQEYEMDGACDGNASDAVDLALSDYPFTAPAVRPAVI